MSITDSVAIGFVAGALTTFASLPQIIYVMRKRSMDDISLVTLSMFAAGVALWLLYGLVIGSTPVVIWNLLSLCLYLTQIGLKLTISGEAASIVERLPQLFPWVAGLKHRRRTS